MTRCIGLICRGASTGKVYTVSLEVGTAPSNGSATINSNGTSNYTPGSGYSGTDSFTYSISDGRGGADSAEVTITVGSFGGDTIRVDGIVMNWVVAGKSWKATTTVHVINQTSQPAAGVTVTGNWSFNGSLIQTGAVRTTDANGLVLFTSAPTKSSGTFQFQITDASLTGATCDSGSSVRQGSIIH
jgi:large repetitive protein